MNFVPKPLVRWLLSGLALLLLLSYWPTLVAIVRGWSRDPVHSEFGPSHGAFVPVFALIVFWARRRLLWEPADSSTGYRWLGLALLVLTLPLRGIAWYGDYVSLDGFSLVPTLTGLALLIGGWNAFRAAWPSLVLLLLMLPWPYAVELAVVEPLRHAVAAASTYLLQTLGYPVFLEGAIIRIERLSLEVIDACSGLGMMLTFLALSLTIAFLSRAPLANRIVMVASSLLFAVATNVLRIAATAAAYYAWGPGPESTFVHDLAGWLMMPVALALLWLELGLLKRLLLPVESNALSPMFLNVVPER